MSKKRAASSLEEPVDHDMNMDMDNTDMGPRGQNPSTGHTAETGAGVGTATLTDTNTGKDMDMDMDTKMETGATKKAKMEGSEMEQSQFAPPVGRGLNEHEISLQQLGEEREALEIEIGNITADKARAQEARQAILDSPSKDEEAFRKAEADLAAVHKEYLRVWFRHKLVVMEITSSNLDEAVRQAEAFTDSERR